MGRSPMWTASRSTTPTGTSTCARRTPSRCCASRSSRSSRARTWSGAAMRSWGSFAASGAALALLCAAPAPAKPVGEFARATNASLDASRAARPRAEAAAQRRRDAAASCLDVFKATPLPNREQLDAAYFIDVASGLYEIETPLLRRLLDRLERVRLRPEPELMKARRLLRSEVALLELLPLIVLDDACRTARDWQAAGWRTPPRSIRAIRRLQTLSAGADEDLTPAAKLLAAGGHRRASRLVLDDYDQFGDEGVELAGDPVHCALMPDDCS